MVPVAVNSTIYKRTSIIHGNGKAAMFGWVKSTAFNIAGK